MATVTQQLKSRREAAWRTRRLIVDDDGDLVYHPRTQDGPEAFCELRLSDCIGQPVDSVAWCMMWAIAHYGQSKDLPSETMTRYWQTQLNGVPFQANLPDPTHAVEAFCREHGIEVFGSVRMNDSHDALAIPFDKLEYPLKVEHPEWLIGDVSQRGMVYDGLPAAMWSGMDYAHPGVREDRLRWIVHTAEHYDLDGIDLNFFRMPWLFKLGEESKHMYLMTDLIREARRRLDAIGERRGRPVLLGVRVPGTVETCLRIGIDIETWLREYLVDRMLTGGGYVAFSTPVEELIELGHSCDVPVYPCINCGMQIYAQPEALFGAASNFLHAGADGIYLWNYHYRAASVRSYGRPEVDEYKYLTPMGDPATLAKQNKLFAVDATQPQFEQYARASAPHPLPLEITDTRTHRINVKVGDDLKQQKPNEIKLRLQFTADVDPRGVEATMNGILVTHASQNAADLNAITYPLDSAILKQGDNELDLVVTSTDPLKLEQVWVVANYQ